MRRKSPSSNNDWTALCVEAAVGGLSALAAVPCRKLVDDPILLRLLRATATEASAAAGKAGLPVSGRPGDLAARDCRRSPRRIHPWLRALRAGRASGAAAVFGPLLKAARRAGAPVPKLAIMAEVLRRLDRKR
jgi:ketopantoate reductase